MSTVEETLRIALPEFNRIRVPEVEVKISKVSEEGFTAFFSGSFCHTCGYYDYFEDLLYLLLDDYGVHTVIKEIEQREDGDYVKYAVISPHENPHV